MCWWSLQGWIVCNDCRSTPEASRATSAAIASPTTPAGSHPLSSRSCRLIWLNILIHSFIYIHPSVSVSEDDTTHFSILFQSPRRTEHDQHHMKLAYCYVHQCELRACTIYETFYNKEGFYPLLFALISKGRKIPALAHAVYVEMYRADISHGNRWLHRFIR
jgi:hypothetical protein